MAGTSRRLSPLDAAFLYFEKPYQRLHVGCVALVDGAFPFPAFSAAMADRLGRIPRYRQRPVRPWLDFDWPHWEEDLGFEIGHHVRHVAVAPPGGERELHELVDTLFGMPLDASRSLWETYLIDGLAGGRSAILSKVHHSMIDGVSGAQVLQVMSDQPPRTPDRAAPLPPGAPAPTRGGLRALLDPTALLGRARDALEVAGTIATFVREPASTLPFTGVLTDTRQIVWAAFPLDDFLAIRGADGCKVNDAVLAVIAGALRRYLDQRGEHPDRLTVRTLVPVSMRGAEDALSMGNLVSAMFPRLPVHLADPIERLRHVAGEMRALKERGQARASGLLLAAAGRIPAPLGALLARLLPDRSVVNTVCTNVPGPREACTILGRPIVDVHPIVPLFQGMGMEFAIMSYAGRLSICAAVDPHLVPDAASLADHLRASVAELVAALAVAPAPAARPAASGPRVGQLMSTPVVAIAESDPCTRAFAVMRQRRIRHLPVVDGAGRLIGLLTHRDLLAASSSSLTYPDEGDRVRLLAWARASDVMETHVSVATPDDPAADAGERMVRQKIGCLPVVDGSGHLVGIVTEEDFLRWATARMAPGEARHSA